MRMSISTTSGSSRPASLTAAVPSAASPTTSIVASLERTAFRPARIRSSSSTISTCTGSRASLTVALYVIIAATIAGAIFAWRDVTA
jgi:hypothetical protein